MVVASPAEPNCSSNSVTSKHKIYQISQIGALAYGDIGNGIFEVTNVSDKK